MINTFTTTLTLHNYSKIKGKISFFAQLHEKRAQSVFFRPGFLAGGKHFPRGKNALCALLTCTKIIVSVQRLVRN